ncbi:MAG: ORF6N domain-containing protein [Prevotella sp.]|nr:ORF6N domain-containing protein [Prevotella sp.]
MEKQLEPIRNKIYEIRGQRVMLDRDLAELYQVTTGNLNKAVKRNMKRFPPDFMFQLTREEFEELRSNLIFQNGISSWGGTRKLPYAFTQAGLAMLSGILNSDIAIDANIKIMRIFVSFYTVPTLSVTSERLSKIESEIQHIKQDMEESLADQNDINESTRAQLDAISEALAELQPREPKPRRRIGFIQEE